MKKINFKYGYLSILLAVVVTLSSCRKYDDNVKLPEVKINEQVNDFIWKGLNTYYFWQEHVPDLDDDIKNESRYHSLISAENPEDLFYNLCYKHAMVVGNNDAVDRFSWIVKDYEKLEGVFAGITKTHGGEFGLVRIDGGGILGFIQYVLPGSDAEAKGLKRGELFYAVNGTQLNVSNYRKLLFESGDTYILNFADLNGDSLVPNGRNVTLTASRYKEDPIYIHKIFEDVGGKKVGYLMYNGFISEYDKELNDVFGEFARSGIDELVLDLRYNPGGAIISTVNLADMINGRLAGQVFYQTFWNNKLRRQNDEKTTFRDKLVVYEGDRMVEEEINSLNLDRIFVLATYSSASASELLINGLRPYMEVIHIGQSTRGKNQGSVTLYDSNNFRKNGTLNKKHKWAMQPIVFKLANSEGFGDYEKGLQPTERYKYKEDLRTLKEAAPLGNEKEPMLKIALDEIGGVAAKAPLPVISTFPYESIDDSKTHRGTGDGMYKRSTDDL